MTKTDLNLKNYFFFQHSDEEEEAEEDEESSPEWHQWQPKEEGGCYD